MSISSDNERRESVQLSPRATEAVAKLSAFKDLFDQTFVQILEGRVNRSGQVSPDLVCGSN